MNNKYLPLKISILSFLLALIDVLMSNFGRIVGSDSINSRVHKEFWVLLPIVFLTFIPIVFKQYRKTCWTKCGIIFLVSVTIINLILYLIMEGNEVYYRDLWRKEHYTWSECPPIRWDFWNILF